MAAKMNQSLRRSGPAIALIVFVLAGCQADKQGGASAAIEAYLAARVESDIDRMTLLSCPAWEANARVEATSFQSMDARLDGVSCSVSETDGTTALVACTGQIVTTYQGETRQWTVAEHPYQAVLDDGEWRMCGYGE
jgi:hypothetical protein